MPSAHTYSMHGSSSRPPGHVLADKTPAVPASRSSPFPATPLRCQGSRELVALSTTSVFNVPQQHDSEVIVPLGAVLSPMPSLSLPTYTVDPETCSRCGAFLNVYSPACGDHSEWHCNFCLHLNTPHQSRPLAPHHLSPASPSSRHSSRSSSPEALASGQAVLNAQVVDELVRGGGSGAGGQLDQDVQNHSLSTTSPTGPPAIHAYITPPPHLTLPAANSSQHSAHSGPAPLASPHPRLQQEAVDYIHHTEGDPSASPWEETKNRHLRWWPGGAPTVQPSGPIVFVVDLVTNPSDLAVVKGAVLRAVDALPSTARVALVTCGSAVHVYRLGDSIPEAVQCDVLPGNVEQGQVPLGVLRPGVHTCTVQQCREAVRLAIQSVRPHQPPQPRPRCLLGAVQAAVHLCRLPSPPAQHSMHHATHHLGTLQHQHHHHQQQQQQSTRHPDHATHQQPQQHLTHQRAIDAQHHPPQYGEGGEGEAGGEEGGAEPVGRLGWRRGATEGEGPEVCESVLQVEALGGWRGHGGARVPGLLEAQQAQRAPSEQSMREIEGESGGSPGHVVVVTTGAAEQGYMYFLPTLDRQQGHAEDEGGEGGASGFQAASPRPPLPAQATLQVTRLANTAALQGIGVDVLAAGVDLDQIPALAPLAQGTAGLFIQHRTCGEAFAANVVAASRSPPGLTASLEVRTSSGLSVRDTYGAVVPLYCQGQPTRQWEALRGNGFPPPPRCLNRRTWHYRCTAPSDSSGVTLTLLCDKPPPQTYLYLQVVWRWVGEGGVPLTRIVTRRLSTTNNPAAAAEAIDPMVGALVWGKSLVASALERGAAFVREEAEQLGGELGRQLFQLASRFGFPDPGSRGWLGGHSRYQLPASFLPLAQLLYHLSRGPMLQYNHPGGHPEEQALLQAHFMTASRDVSRLMANPSLFTLPRHQPSLPRDQPQTALVPPPNKHGLSLKLEDLPGASGDPPSPTPQQSAGQYDESPSSTGSTKIRAVQGVVPQLSPLAPPAPPGEGLPWRTCFAAAPAVLSVLQGAAAAVLDHGSHLYIWVAPGLEEHEQGQVEGMCWRYARHLGAGRVPIPEVVYDPQLLPALLSLDGGDSQQAQQSPLKGRPRSNSSARQPRGCLGEEGGAPIPTMEQWLRSHGIVVPPDMVRPTGKGEGRMG